MLPLILAGGTFAATAFTAFRKGEISRQEYEQAIAAADELERKLKTLRPDETWESIDPQLLSEVAKFSPDIAAFVQENAPQLIQEPQSQTEKQVQREALQTLAAQAETGRDVISEAQREQALFEADARSKARRGQLMEALRRQGALGSGAGLVAQLQGEQEAARGAREEALRGTQEAEMRRRQALGQAATLAGQIRGQNLEVESANVGTMNSYNQRLANARNLYNQYASGERNRAQAINQQRDMDRARYNLELGNKYAMYNREQQLNAKERARQFDVDLATRMYGIRQGAEANRFQGERQFLSDMGTAVTSSLGTGMSAYGMGLQADQAAAAVGESASKKAYYDSLLRSAGRGAVEGAAQKLGGATASSLYRPAPPQDIEMKRKPKRNALWETIDEEMSEGDIIDPDTGLPIYRGYGRNDV